MRRRVLQRPPDEVKPTTNPIPGWVAIHRGLKALPLFALSPMAETLVSFNWHLVVSGRDFAQSAWHECEQKSALSIICGLGFGFASDRLCTAD
jgi:hypothetical protein